LCRSTWTVGSGTIVSSVLANGAAVLIQEGVSLVFEARLCAPARWHLLRGTEGVFTHVPRAEALMIVEVEDDCAGGEYRVALAGLTAECVEVTVKQIAPLLSQAMQQETPPLCPGGTFFERLLKRWRSNRPCLCSFYEALCGQCSMPDGKVAMFGKTTQRVVNEVNVE
jgi:hypothetical protein